jgi:MoxR-like ATPase
MSNNTQAYEALQQAVATYHPILQNIRQEVGKRVVGQAYMVDRLLTGLLCNGHILLEGVPGLAKTLTIRSLAGALGLQFGRIQFTPDLLPADIIGTMMYQQHKGEFAVKKGPVFANLLLADEINRAPAKVQSALLEAMQEKQVTIGEQSYALPQPFLVMATQNPLEQEGTYPLPEAQQDRFMMKVMITYPTRSEELLVMRQEAQGGSNSPATPVANAAALQEGARLCRQVWLNEKIENYILDIVLATRQPQAFGLPGLQPLIAYGASPRASIHLAMAARGMAMLQQRAYVVPDDVLSVAPDVLRHRIGLTYEADAEDKGMDFILSQILKTIPAP